MCALKIAFHLNTVLTCQVASGDASSHRDDLWILFTHLANEECHRFVHLMDIDQSVLNGGEITPKRGLI